MLRLRGFSESSFIFDDPILIGTKKMGPSPLDDSEETDECIKIIDIFSRVDVSVDDGPEETLNYIRAYNVQYNVKKADPKADWHVETDALPREVRAFQDIGYVEQGEWRIPISSPDSVCARSYSPPPPPPSANDPNRNLLTCIWSDPDYEDGRETSPIVGRTVLFRHVFGLPRGRILGEPQMYLTVDDDAIDPEVRSYDTRRGFIFVNGSPVRFHDTKGMNVGNIIIFRDPNSQFNLGGKNLLAFMVNDEMEYWQTLKYFLRIRVQLEDCAPPPCRFFPGLDVCVRSMDVLIENTTLAPPPYLQRYSAGGVGSKGNPEGVFEHYDPTFQLDSEWIDLTTAGPNVVTSRADESAQSRISICDLGFEHKIFPQPDSTVVLKSQSLSTIVKPTLGNDWSGVPVREYGLFAEYLIRNPLGTAELYGARITIAPDDVASSVPSRSFFNVAPLQQMKSPSPFQYIVGRSYPSTIENYPLINDRMYRMCLITRAIFYFTSGVISGYALDGSVQINSFHNTILFRIDFAGNVVGVTINPETFFFNSRIGLINMNGSARFESTEVRRNT